MDQRHKLDTLWKTSGLAWSVICGEVLALVLALAPGIGGDRLIWFGLNSLIIQWIILLTLGLLYLLRPLLARLGNSTLAVAGIIILLLATWLTIGILWLTFSEPLRLAHGSLLELATLATSLALVVGLLALVALQNHLRLQQLAVQATRAELQALQARIRPHFLFNTLNSAVAMLRTQPAQTEDLLMDMADLFRIALAPDQQISLAREIELCQRYLAIEQARFGQRLQTEWDLPSPLPGIQLPPLCLQPLIENAVHHGVERSHQPSTISVKAAVEDGLLKIQVRNPLHGEQPASHNGHGVGLQAVRARLASFSSQARLETSRAGDHYLASLHLPLNTPDQVSTR